jgi:hypothetical protein
LLTSVSANAFAERRRRSDCAACAVEAVDALRYAEAQVTVMLNDGLAVLDRERPDVDSKAG